MSFRPRRTTAIGESSTSKAARCSRIAQPIRRPSMRERSLERSSSMDRLSNVAYLQASAAKRSRSASATPMRTPNRPIPHSGPGIQMTSEKERAPLDDKKFIQSQAARIVEYLIAIEHPLGKDLFQRGGLKSMSTKQFVHIFEHFLKFIAGNRLKIGTNYVDDIVKVLAQIEYPYTINKSWLKTPNAPHAFSNVVVLQGWMLRFVPVPGVVGEFEIELLIKADNMYEFDLKFIVAAKEGFYHWNNNKNDEFDSLKTDLCDNFIQKRAGMESFAFLVSKIKRLAAEVQKLDRSKTTAKSKEEWSRLDLECADLEHKERVTQRRVAKLKKSQTENSQKIARIEESIESREKQKAERLLRIETVAHIVRKQPMSMKDRDQLVSNVHSLKQLLDSKKDSAFELQDIDASQQVAYSRLLKQKIEKVTDFNKYLYKIFSVCEGIAVVNVQDLCLDQNCEISLDDQIDKDVPFLENLKRICQQQLADATQHVAELENQLKILLYEHDTLMDQKQSAIVHRGQEFAAKIEELDMEIINRQGHRSKEVELRSDRIRKLIELNVSLRDKLSVKIVEQERLKKENEEMAAKVEAKCDEIVQAKKARVRMLRENVNRFCKTLEEINLDLNAIPK